MAERFAIFVHDPNGDMGDAVVVGPIGSGEKADRRAETIRKEAERYYDGEVECIVVRVAPADDAARRILDRLQA